MGLPDADLDALQRVLDNIGERLGIVFELQSASGDIVLLDVPFASSVSSELMQGLADKRPVVLLAGLHGDDEWLLNYQQRFARRERLLLQQLCNLQLVQKHATGWLGDRWTTDAWEAPSTQSGGNSQFFSSMLPVQDSGFDARAEQAGWRTDPVPGSAQLQLLRSILAGRNDPQRSALAASYGPNANLRFNFQARTVEVDLLAQRLLRVHREIPQLAPHAAPAADAIVRALDETLWDLGMACGTQPLLDEPTNWWRTPVQFNAWKHASAAPGAAVASYSRTPRHLELARCLEEGPATPAVLSRRARIDVVDLRGFLQACLVLKLVMWCPPLLPERQAARSENCSSGVDRQPQARPLPHV